MGESKVVMCLKCVLNIDCIIFSNKIQIRCCTENWSNLLLFYIPIGNNLLWQYSLVQ